MNPSRQLAFTFALIAILIGPVLHAQNPRGSVRGTVQDASGARIGSARIVAQLEGSSLQRRVSSEDRGGLRLDDLLPGTYRVTINAPGFAPAEAEVVVAVSTVHDITVTLKPSSVRQSVKVQGEISSITTEPVDTSSAVRGGVVGSRRSSKPCRCQRAASPTSRIWCLARNQSNPPNPTKARITAVSTGGSSGLNNELSVDGADNSDDWIGGFLQNFSPDGIQEFAVRTSNEDADTGWTTAGSVVITTKRGTNDWHGDAAFYGRAAALNARFPIENPAETCTNGACVNNPKQPFSRQNYVGTIGGPIAKDKAWFFASFENVHEDASIAYSPTSIAQFDALAQLAAEGLIAGVPSISVPPNRPDSLSRLSQFFAL